MAEEWVGYDGGAVQERHRTASRIRVASDVTVIPQEAFMDCAGLQAVDLGNVTAISKNSFNCCQFLERVVWTSAPAVEIGVGAFASCKRLGEIDLSNATKIGVGAFYNCHALNRVTIPSYVDEIEASAFMVCKSLAEVELGEGARRIGARAFFNCGSLVQINIPPSVTDIGSKAFYECNNLRVELNEGLQRIGKAVFQDCASLVDITIPSTTLEVGDNAFFHCRQLRHAELQEGLQVIGNGAFNRCYSLERITIPSSVTLIGEYAFQSCGSLSEVTLCEGIQCVGEGAFGGFFGTPLERINIPPVALVIDIERSDCQLSRATMPIPRERRLIVSKWLQYRSRDQLEEAEARVNEILGRRRQPVVQKIACIREWFAYYDRLDVTTMLELAIWRCNLNGNEQGAEARQTRRRACGNGINIIIPGVLRYLER